MSTNSLSVHTRQLETLLKNLPGMAYRCLNHEHWPMDFVSDGCFELCGYERETLEKQQILWGDFTHPDDIDEVDRKVRSATEKGQPFEVEYRIITRGDEVKWVWERGRVVDVRDDGIAVLEGFITDITDRKISETALKNAEAFAQAVLETAVEAVITIDKSGNIESFNLAAQEMFGYQPSEIYGIPCRQLVPVGHYREFDQHLNGCLITSDHLGVSREFNGYRKNSTEFPIILSISRIQSVQEKKYVVLIRDVTSQRSAEKEAREQREVLAHVDRLNTLGEMAAGIAHEINQPLTAISMYAKSGLNLLNNHTPKIGSIHDALEKLSAQAHRAGAVIERMQRMIKQRNSQQDVIGCETLLREVRRLAEVEAHLKNMIIVLRIEDNPPKVRCDVIQIQQVILNLLRNGMEAMSLYNKSNQIILQSTYHNQEITISIIDSGCGISKRLEKELYKPFTTTKESGMGLGLSISRSIIASHGSQLQYKHNASGGATFYFTLPVATEE